MNNYGGYTAVSGESEVVSIHPAASAHLPACSFLSHVCVIE